MSSFKQFVASILLLLSVEMGFVFFAMPSAEAATSLLPGAENTVADVLTAEECYTIVQVWDQLYAEKGYSGLPTSETYQDYDAMTSTDMMTCALKSGNMHFWMVPYFVNYALEFVINVAGVLVVLMIVIGGYFYIYGAVTDDKEKGKSIITYAIGGYVLVLTSWFIVNALLLAVTQ